MSNHSSEIDFKDFTNIYKKCTAKPSSFFVIDTTLSQDNPLRFRENSFEITCKLIMNIDDKITNQKLRSSLQRWGKNISIMIK